MKKYYPVLLIPLFILIFTSNSHAQYITQNYATDVKLYRDWAQYPNDLALTNMFEEIAAVYPQWHAQFDYVVYYYNSTQTRIRLIQKIDPRSRQVSAVIEADTSKDIDFWSLNVGPTLNEIYMTYTFTTATGGMVEGTSYSPTLNEDMTDRMFYHNLPMKVRVGYYTGSPITSTTWVDMTTMEKRPLPNFLLINLGVVSQDGVVISDKLDNQLTFWQNLNYGFLKIFTPNLAKEYYDAVTENDYSFIENVTSNFSIAEYLNYLVSTLLDAVVGIVIFAFKTLELLVNTGQKLLLTIISMGIKSTQVLNLFNTKIAQTPTFIQPIYQASFTIFPAIMGLSVIKFFIRIFRG